MLHYDHYSGVMQMIKALRNVMAISTAVGVSEPAVIMHDRICLPVASLLSPVAHGVSLLRCNTVTDIVDRIQITCSHTWILGVVSKQILLVAESGTPAL